MQHNDTFYMLGLATGAALYFLIDVVRHHQRRKRRQRRREASLRSRL